MQVILCSRVPDDNILAKEIESWKGFENALRRPNATHFNKMLNECLESKEYAAAFKNKGRGYSAESLFMASIFHQQKMISKLIQQIQSVQRRIKLVVSASDRRHTCIESSNAKR
jgi:hypothetical protein